MARLTELEDHLSQKDEAKKRRSLRYHRGSWPCHLPTKASNHLEDSQHLSCNLTAPNKENDTYGTNFTEPPPELLEGEEVYEIETILNHQKCGWGYQYLIKWTGYPISYASWEPELCFSNDGNTLEQYKLRHGLK